MSRPINGVRPRRHQPITTQSANKKTSIGKASSKKKSTEAHAKSAVDQASKYAPWDTDSTNAVCEMQPSVGEQEGSTKPLSCSQDGLADVPVELPVTESRPKETASAAGGAGGAPGQGGDTYLGNDGTRGAPSAPMPKPEPQKPPVFAPQTYLKGPAVCVGVSVQGQVSVGVGPVHDGGTVGQEQGVCFDSRGNAQAYVTVPTIDGKCPTGPVTTIPDGVGTTKSLSAPSSLIDVNASVSAEANIAYAPDAQKLPGVGTKYSVAVGGKGTTAGVSVSASSVGISGGLAADSSKSPFSASSTETCTLFRQHEDAP